VYGHLAFPGRDSTLTGVEQPVKGRKSRERERERERGKYVGSRLWNVDRDCEEREMDMEIKTSEVIIIIIIIIIIIVVISFMQGIYTYHGLIVYY